MGDFLREKYEEIEATADACDKNKEYEKDGEESGAVKEHLVSAES